MADLRVSKKHNKWVIQDRDQNRKQIGKPFINKRDAFVFLNQIIAGILRKRDFKKYFYALKYRHLFKNSIRYMSEKFKI